MQERKCFIHVPTATINKIEILQSKTRKIDKEKGKNLKKLLYVGCKLLACQFRALPPTHVAFDTVTNWYYHLPITNSALGVLRVITRPELDPTRSKESKIPDPYPTRKFQETNYPTRPELGIFKTDPKKIKLFKNKAFKIN